MISRSEKLSYQSCAAAICEEHTTVFSPFPSLFHNSSGRDRYRLVDVQEKQPDIERVSANTLVFPFDPYEPLIA